MIDWETRMRWQSPLQQTDLQQVRRKLRRLPEDAKWRGRLRTIGGSSE